MKRNTVTLRTFAAATVAIVLLAGAGALRAADKWVAPANANAKKNPLASNAASIQAGEKIYARECLSCHGKKGLGDGPKASELTVTPGNLTTLDVQGQSDGALFWKITNGRKPMPSFKTAFTEEERWQVLNYMRTLSGRGTITKAAH